MPTPLVSLTGITDTSERFFVPGPAPYSVAISGAWNGGSATLERLLTDARTWAAIEIDRRAKYREGGWTRFEEDAPPHTIEEVTVERARHIGRD